MKEELLEKVYALSKALDELGQTWEKIDWSVVPETVSENYPFHEELSKMSENIEIWFNSIKNS